MAKRKFIDVSQIENISLEDSLHYMEWYKSSEVEYDIVAPRLTEQDIVKPYIDKLSKKVADMEFGIGYEPWEVRNEILKVINNLLSEQGE